MMVCHCGREMAQLQRKPGEVRAWRCTEGHVMERVPEFMTHKRHGRGDDHDNRIDEQKEGK